MRRLYVLLAATALAVGVGTSVGASAPPDTPPVPMAVPDDSGSLVGSWMLTDVTDPANPDMFLASFSSDGIYTQMDPDGNGGIGNWTSTSSVDCAPDVHRAVVQRGRQPWRLCRACEHRDVTGRQRSDSDFHLGSPWWCPASRRRVRSRYGDRTTHGCRADGSCGWLTGRPVRQLR